MNIPGKTITELSELLRKNLKETQVSLPVGMGSYKKRGKICEYAIYVMIRETEDFEDV